MSAKKIRTSILSFLNDAKGSIADELESRRQQAEKDFADFYKSAQSTQQELDSATATREKNHQERQDWQDRAEASERKLVELQQQLDSSERKLRKATSQTRDLFHFTAAAYLPEILKSGITRGCVSVNLRRPYSSQPQAGCLTSNGDGWDQAWADGAAMDRRKIRLTVRVPDCDVTSFSEVQANYRMSKEDVEVLDRLNQRNHWYFAFAGLAPDTIVKIEVWTERGYEEVSGDELDELVADIEEEIEAKLDFGTVEDGFLRGARCCDLKRGATSSWLFDAAVDDVLSA